MFRVVPHRVIGDLKLTNTPIKLSSTPGGIRGTSPDMGEHSREVLAELLGLDGARLDDLVARQVVWEERPEVELG
jgi:crotonobetainyl-CoA:carnitine CoA-transferase CaiB-like acyl-CoA transferase